jgi:hypothetical protein
VVECWGEIRPWLRPLVALRGSRDATDYGRRPVTCNTCNNGGFLRFLLLQVDGIFPEMRCNLKPKGESRAFSDFFRSFRS